MTANTYAERDLIRAVVMKSDDGGLTWYADPTGGGGSDIAAIRPSGEITMYGGAAAPTGWLLCNGASYLRSAHAALFAAIGTAFGAADGTHFNVPDMRDKFTKGANGDLGTSVAATTHTHAVGTIAAGSHTHTTSAITVNSHTHGLNSHTHGIGSYSSQGHYHRFDGIEVGDGTVYGLAAANNTAAGQFAQRRVAGTFTPTHQGGDAFHALSVFTTSQANGSALYGNTYWGHYLDGTVAAGASAALTAGGVSGASAGSTATASADGLTGSTDGTTPSMSGTSASTTAPNPANVSVNYIIRD